MKPVFVFRHIACEGPGYLADFLSARNIPSEIIRIDEGEPVLANPDNASGLVLMGGPMSANDDLPWIHAELDLIRNAHSRQIPVLGHCLGGQLISKALGGRVERNKVTEIGWFTVERSADNNSPDWLDDLDFDTEIFHWHGETFTLPDQAILLFRNRFCENQAYVLNNTYALQCHVEMTTEAVPEWLEFYKHDMPEPCESVQSGDEMLRDIEQRIASLQKFADVIYTQWMKAFNN
jgi:GMP synthase-like glutamine amidotransferase